MIKMYDGRWNLDALYTGFDSDKFKSDMARLDEVNALLGAEAKRLAGRSPRENLMATVPLLEEHKLLSCALSDYCLFRQTTDDLQHLAGQLRVQRRGGLVEAENIRVERQCPGDGHPLLLTARKIAGIFMRLGFQTHFAQQLHSGSLRFRTALAQNAHRRFRDVSQHGKVWEKVEVLENQTYFQTHISQRLGICIDCLAVFIGGHHGDAADIYSAAVSLFKLVHAPEKSGFSASRGAYDGNSLSLFNGKGDVFQYLQLSEAFGQIFYFKHCHKNLPFLIYSS